MSDWQAAQLTCRNGWLGIAPIPGRTGRYEADFNALLRWQPDVVLTMTTANEIERVGASSFAEDLLLAGIQWRHIPIVDFGAPNQEVESLWREASELAHSTLDSGGKVLAHCFGGCGRSGMAVMRILVESGENADPALERLRDARPCAVETEEQRAWAGAPMFDRLSGTNR